MQNTEKGLIRKKKKKKREFEVFLFFLYLGNRSLRWWNTAQFG
jgi:hypothetical protein